MSRYRIVRDDGCRDAIAGQEFDSYDAAHAVLEVDWLFWTGPIVNL